MASERYGVEDGIFFKEFGEDYSVAQATYGPFLDGEVEVRQKDRARYEQEADGYLTEHYIAHHGVTAVDEEEGRVELELLEDGEPLPDRLAAPDGAEGYGEMLGRLLRDLHRTGAAQGDPVVENFFERDGDLLSTDHEFFIEDAGETDRRADLQLVQASAKALEPEIYRPFMDGFEHGYTDETREHEDNILERYDEVDELQAAGYGLAYRFGDLEKMRNIVRNTDTALLSGESICEGLEPVRELSLAEFYDYFTG